MKRFHGSKRYRSPRRKSRPQKSKRIQSPVNFVQKLSKGPVKGKGFKFKRSVSFSIKKPKIPEKARECRSMSPTLCRPPDIQPNYSSNVFEYIPSENMVISYDKEEKQYIGILLKNNVYNYAENMYWLNILEKEYNCINIKSNFNFDGYSIYQVLNLLKFNQNIPFRIEWIRTDIYTSYSFDIKTINQRGIVYEQYLINNQKYHNRYDCPKCCNYIYRCIECTYYFPSKERRNKCRWCSVLHKIIY